MDLSIEQINEVENGFFRAMDHGIEAGRMTYTWPTKDRFIIDHTEVHKPYLGLGIGKKMVMAAVKYARENDLKIVPICPFAKSLFEKITEINDVL